MVGSSSADLTCRRVCAVPENEKKNQIIFENK